MHKSGPISTPKDQIQADAKENVEKEDVKIPPTVPPSQLASLISLQPPKGWGCRYTMVIMSFLGLVVAFMMRINLSIAIVSMVYENETIDTHDKSHEGCPQPEKSFHKSKMSDYEGEFLWTRKEQGLILGAYFWGYILTQLPGGWLSYNYGSKWPFGIGVFIGSASSVLSPVSARAGIAAFFIMRFIQGLAQGVLVSAIHGLISQWAPLKERTKITGFVYCGIQIGYVMSLILSGVLINNNVMGGWPSVFYIFGIISFVWCGFWVYYVFDTPAKHPRISPEERKYIQVTRGVKSSGKHVNPPWKKILTSAPIWAIMVANFGNNWGQYTMVILLPSYMKSVMHFDIQENSYLSALPFLFQAIVGVICSSLANYLIKNKILRNITVRKGFCTMGLWGSCIFLLIASFTGCNKPLTVSMLTLATGIRGAVWSAAIPVNMIELSPEHAGIIMGISNGIANLCGILTPAVAGFILEHGDTVANWRIVFLLAAGIDFVANVIYLIYASSELQPWAYEKDPSIVSESKNNLSESPAVTSVIPNDMNAESVETLRKQYSIGINAAGDGVLETPLPPPPT